MVDPATSSWFTVTVTCQPEAAEVLADVLWRSEPPAVEERGVVGTDMVVLLAGYPSEDVAESTAAALAATGATGIVSVTVTAVVDDGLDAWRDHARVEHAGPFTLVPSWIDQEPEADGHTLRIDPGPTFGSGSHPTTRLVLAALPDLVEPGRRVLDVGCGSGVLAVAAALLGAEVAGIDIDPASPEVMAANASANGVEGRVRFDTRPLAAVADAARTTGERFHLVLANLLSPIIVELAADLVEVVEAGGHLVVSGLLDDRRGPAMEALADLGSVELVGEAVEDGWVALTFRRLSL